MADRPKIALVPSVAEWFKEEWFRDANVAQTQSAGRYSVVLRQIQDDITGMTAALGKSVEVVSPGLIFEVAQVAGAVEMIKQADPDLLVICVMMWTEDPALLTLVASLPDIPVVLWCYSPPGASSDHMKMEELFSRSATVGAFQIAGALQRLRPDVQLVIGNFREAEALQPLLHAARAAWVCRKLKTARFAQVPAPYPGMSDLPAEIERVGRAFDCAVEKRPMSDFLKLADTITDQEINALLKSLEKLPRRGVTEEQLERGARASLTLAKTPQAWGIDGIALDDLHVELHEKLGARLALPVQDFFENGHVYGIEGDLVQAIACWIFHQLTQQPAMFVEIFHADPIKDILVPGHAGLHDMRIADPKTIILTPDYEYETAPRHGPWAEFTPQAGPATLAQFVVEGEKPRLLLVEGELLPIAGKVEGFPAGVLKTNRPVRDFMQWAFSSHTTHHWALMPGKQKSALIALAHLMQMAVCQLDF